MPDNQSLLDLLNRIVGTGQELTADERRAALRLFERLSGAPGTARPPAQAVSNRRLVYVHGITRHEEGFSDSWWESLRPFVAGTFGEGTLNETRHEVIWSDLVNAPAAAMALAERAPQRERVAEEIRETLLDRMDREALAAAPAATGREIPAAAIPLPQRGILDTLGGIDDFVIYLLNDATRAQIIGRFTDKLSELLAEGAEVDVISHSWGTVVAYEGLRELEDQGFTDSRVRNFFTVGAALSIPPVKRRLRRANRDGRKPELVSRWVNLDARGDVVGGPLQGRPYHVDEDFPNLEPTGCAAGFLGRISPSCAHGSYFVSENEAVNRDIFAHFILS